MKEALFLRTVDAIVRRVEIERDFIGRCRNNKAPPSVVRRPPRKSATICRRPYAVKSIRSVLHSVILASPCVCMEMFDQTLSYEIQGSLAISIAQSADKISGLTVKQASAWGLGPFLRRSGVEKGDYLLIVFQPSKKVATVVVGDEGLLEQYEDAA